MSRHVVGSMFREADRQEMLARLRRLTPDSPGLWGRMSAPRMVTHLVDQMRYTLGDIPATMRPGLWRHQPAKFVALYLLPWPKGRIEGPPEMFVTPPASWEHDVAALETLVRRFADQDRARAWPEHPFLGRLSGWQWGVFVHRHFDHHVRQFGG